VSSRDTQVKSLAGELQGSAWRVLVGDEIWGAPGMRIHAAMPFTFMLVSKYPSGASPHLRAQTWLARATCQRPTSTAPCRTTITAYAPFRAFSGVAPWPFESENRPQLYARNRLCNSVVHVAGNARKPAGFC
jgi:hypothetical protein